LAKKFAKSADPPLPGRPPKKMVGDTRRTPGTALIRPL
jgi:hypothetical protein